MRADLPTGNRAGEMEEAKPGLYLRLFHGRKSPAQDMTDWGFDGPMIGPLEYVHTTYNAEVKIKFVDDNRHDFEKYFPAEMARENAQAKDNTNWYVSTETQLAMVEDLLVYEGEYFGDWSVFVVGNVMPTAAQIAKGLST